MYGAAVGTAQAGTAGAIAARTGHFYAGTFGRAEQRFALFRMEFKFTRQDTYAVSQHRIARRWRVGRTVISQGRPLAVVLRKLRALC
jgi:hypothetical protein